jgi:hypothetical protein
MTQLDITQESPSFWRVAFNNPPVNVIGAQMIIEMRAARFPEHSGWAPSSG